MKMDGYSKVLSEC